MSIDLQADRKKHSTVDEAMQVATDMGADRVILTHFSQRYPRLPVGLPVEGDPEYGYHLVAYDGMVVPLSMLKPMPNLMPLLTGSTLACMPECMPDATAEVSCP